MAEYHAAAERHIDAPPERVYACIADHRQHHQHFLPPVFADYRVEEGGVGAGTVVSYSIKSGLRKRRIRARVDEPEPGRVITETDLNGTFVTTFTVEPDGDGSLVRIETISKVPPGVAGAVERLLAPTFLRRLFADELARLELYAASEPSG